MKAQMLAPSSPPADAAASVDRLYTALCRRRAVQPDPALLAALAQRKPHLHVRTEPHLTLLLHALSTTPPPSSLSSSSSPPAPAAPPHAATHLTITAAALPAAAVGTLATYLSHQTHLTHLTVRDVALPPNAAETLLTALAAPSAAASPLSHIALTNAGLTARAAVNLAPLLARPLPALAHLDLSNNATNAAGVHALQRAVARRPPGAAPLEVDLAGNLVTIERLNAVTHGLGALLALVGGGGLTAAAARRSLSNVTVASIATFCISLFTLLASSCAYHSVFRHPRLHAALRRVDHCSIFLLIAGSYTPFVAAYLLDPPTLVGPLTLAAVWICAAAGMARSVVGMGSNRSRALFALSTGWVGLMAIRSFIERMQRDAFFLVLAGGIVYSVGIIFYLLGKKVPFLHVLWHIAVLMGGSLHYFALWRYVVHLP